MKATADTDVVERAINKKAPPTSQKSLQYIIAIYYSLLSNLSISDCSELNVAPSFSIARERVVKTSSGQFPQSFWIRIFLQRTWRKCIVAFFFVANYFLFEYKTNEIRHSETLDWRLFHQRNIF